MLRAKAASCTVVGAKLPRCLSMTSSTAAVRSPEGGSHLEKYHRLFSVISVRVMTYIDSSFLTLLKIMSSVRSHFDFTSLRRVSSPMSEYTVRSASFIVRSRTVAAAYTGMSSATIIWGSSRKTVPTTPSWISSLTQPSTVFLSGSQYG